VTQDQAPVPPARPPRWKQAVITWLAVYPALTLTLAVLGPLIETWPLAFRTLLVTVLLVPIVVYVLLPLLNRAFRGWLFHSA
jgi:antibiotic biosynthesis monooxygenase (ABM) superfamily enzyme